MYGLSAVNEFVLAWSAYSSLQKASEPKDYDVVLSRIIAELQFHCETVSTDLSCTVYFILRSNIFAYIVACHAVLHGNDGYYT